MAELFVLLDPPSRRPGRRSSDNRLSFSYHAAGRTIARCISAFLSLSLHVDRSRPPACRRSAPSSGTCCPTMSARWSDGDSNSTISSGNPFALIGAVGEDCAGAVQIVQPAPIASRRRCADFAGQDRNGWTNKRNRRAACGRCLPTRRAVGARARTGSSAWPVRNPRPPCCSTKGDGAYPSGRTPTTHVLKPPAPNLARPRRKRAFLSRSRTRGSGCRRRVHRA